MRAADFPWERSDEAHAEVWPQGCGVHQLTAPEPGCLPTQHVADREAGTSRILAGLGTKDRSGEGLGDDRALVVDQVGHLVMEGRATTDVIGVQTGRSAP